MASLEFKLQAPPGGQVTVSSVRVKALPGTLTYDVPTGLFTVVLADAAGASRLFCAIVPGLENPISVPPPCQASAATVGVSPDFQAADTHDQRFAFTTRYRVSDDAVWNAVASHGGFAVLGDPLSNLFVLEGCQIEMFERRVLQRCPGGDVTLANWLDAGLLPDGSVQGLALPSVDEVLKDRTPRVGDPAYMSRMRAFVQQAVLSGTGGEGTLFYDFFFRYAGPGSQVSMQSLAAALESWGAPTSRAVASTDGTGVVTQRFQRGVMRYDPKSGTSDVPLVQYVRDILLDKDLPSDLAAEAQASPYFSQYCGDAPLGVCRPDELPDTDLTDAFIRG